MSYSAVLGDLGPVFPLIITDNGVAFVLDTMKDTVTLHYIDPLGVTHSVAMVIQNAATGSLTRTWITGDLPAVGLYTGMVKVVRSMDNTFPRSFPNDGSKLLWRCNQTI